MSLKQFVDYLLLEKNYSQHTVLAYSRDIEAFKVFVKMTFQSDTIDDCYYTQIRSWIKH